MDTLRHAKDVLGWVHVSLAEERELIMRVGQQDDKLLISNALNAISSPLCADLTALLQRLLYQTSTTSAVYKLGQLAMFYARQLAEVMSFGMMRHEDGTEAVVKPSDFDIISTLAKFSRLCQDLYLERLKSERMKIQMNVDPSEFIEETASVVTEVVEMYSSDVGRAFVEGDDDMESLQFGHVLDSILSPLLNSLTWYANGHEDTVLILVNGFAAVEESLKTHSFAKERLAMVTALKDEKLQDVLNDDRTTITSALADTSNVADAFVHFVNLIGSLDYPKISKITHLETRQHARDVLTKQLIDYYHTEVLKGEAGPPEFSVNQLKHQCGVQQD